MIDSGFKAAYVSYADYGGPLVHSREFVRAFRPLVEELVLHCPYLERDLNPVPPGQESFFNRLFARFPAWIRQLKLELYQLRKLLRDWRKRRELRRLFRESGVEIVVIRLDAFVVGAIAAARKERIPYLLEVNGVLSKHSADRVTRAFERYALSGAAGVVTVAEPLGEMLRGLGVPADRLLVVPNGVRVEAYEAPDLEVVPEDTRSRLLDALVVGYLGTFTGYHDTATLVQAFAQARSSEPRLHLLLIGAGMGDRDIRDLVESLDLGDAVSFTGQVPHAHVPSYLALCDILINPVRQIYAEGFHGAPVKLFEYMAAARAIISTDLPNLRGLLADSAVWAHEGDVQSWRAAIEQLAADESRREQKGRAALERLQSEGYTWEENARRIYSFCSDILRRTFAAAG